MFTFDGQDEMPVELDCDLRGVFPLLRQTPKSGLDTARNNWPTSISTGYLVA
jgi:hypothetical protein